MNLTVLLTILGKQEVNIINLLNSSESNRTGFPFPSVSKMNENIFHARRSQTADWCCLPDNLWTVIVFPFVLCVLSSVPVALCRYLKLTAPVWASWTSWCLRLSRLAAPSQRRSASFLRRGSAPSGRALTAWLIPTRSESWTLWEEVSTWTCPHKNTSNCWLNFVSSILQISSEFASPPGSPTR